jgi:hypothetical protein
VRASPSADRKIDRVDRSGPSTSKTAATNETPVAIDVGSPQVIESGEKPPLALGVGAWAPHPAPGTQHKDWMDRLDLWRQDPKMAPAEVVMAARYLTQMKSEHDGVPSLMASAKSEAYRLHADYKQLKLAEPTPEREQALDEVYNQLSFARIDYKNSNRRVSYATQEKEHVDLLARDLLDQGYFGSAKIVEGICRNVLEISRSNPADKAVHQGGYQMKYLMMKPYVSREVLGFDPPDLFQKLAASDSADFDPQVFEAAVNELNTALYQHMGQDLLPVLAAIANRESNSEPWQ